MSLHGQAGERGYAMAALLVSIAVMSVLMTVAMPAWRHQARREKEAELVWRGEQYARAIALYRAKNGNNLPPSIDVLVQGKYLRKKYLDPITNQEFELIHGMQGQQTPGDPSRPQRGFPPLPRPVSNMPVTGGGIGGVRSKSKETSIRVYRGQTKYDQWSFMFNTANVPGATDPTAPGGRRGGPGGGPTSLMPGRGNFPGRGTTPPRGGPGDGQPTRPPRGRGPGV